VCRDARSRAVEHGQRLHHVVDLVARELEHQPVTADHAGALEVADAVLVQITRWSFNLGATDAQPATSAQPTQSSIA